MRIRNRISDGNRQLWNVWTTGKSKISNMEYGSFGKLFHERLKPLKVLTPIIFLALIFSLTNVVYSQTPEIQWQKCLGGTGSDGGSIIQTNDGGFAVAGSSSSDDGDVSGNNGETDAWVVKLDSTATIQWQKCFGGSKTDNMSSIIQTSDGGFILAGNTQSDDGDVSGFLGVSDIWVMKIDSNGSLQWQKCFGGTSIDTLGSIIQTSDGGFVLGAYTWSDDVNVSGNHGGSDAWVVKLDSSGSIQWQKCFGGTNLDTLGSIIQTSDGGFALAGYTASNDGDVSGNHGGADAWVVKLDSTATIQWQKCFGGTSTEAALSIIQTSDGGFALGAYSSSDDGDLSENHGGTDVWVLKLDSIGSIEWQKCLGGTSDERTVSIFQTSDGGFLVNGYTYSDDGDVSGNHGERDAWLITLDSSGAAQSLKCFGGTSIDTLGSIIQTSDSAFVVAGSSYSNDGDVSGNHGSSDLWILEFKLVLHSISGLIQGDVKEGVTLKLSSGETSTSASDGSYSFPSLGNGTYTLTPELNGYDFTPVSRQVTIADADQTNIDFSSTQVSVHTITASAGAGGTITPGGEVQVVAGSSKTFTISANTGYQIADVLIDGASKGGIGSHSFTNIAGDHTITASFTEPAFTISGTVSGAIKENVTLTLSGTSAATVDSDSDGNYGFSNLPNGEYTITPSKTGHTFSPENYDVTVSGADATGKDFTSTKPCELTMAARPLDAGALSPSAGVSTQNSGESFSISATANSGYAFSHWISNAKATLTEPNSATTTATISDSTTITACFEKDISGDVWSFGRNDHGQLGDGTTNDCFSPIKAIGLEKIKRIGGGGACSFAVGLDGSVWTWGKNVDGRLGDGSTMDRHVPTKIENLANIVDASSGETHMLALKKDGTVWSWGHNWYGSLGDGDSKERTAPVQVLGVDGVGYLSDIVAISAGDYHNLALRSDGTVLSWGYGYDGQLGNGGTDCSNTPVEISTLSDVIAISAGNSSYALKSDGLAMAWGPNTHGQLGDDTTSNRTTPVQVQNLTKVSFLKAVDAHVVAMTDDGTTYAWGSNQAGQIGDGSDTAGKLPVSIPEFANLKAVAGGHYYTIVLRNDGTIWACGENPYGQFGNGTNHGSRTPIQINELPSIETLAAGTYAHTLVIGNFVELTMKVSPENSGTVSPTAEKKLMAKDSKQNIAATAVVSHVFKNWTVDSDVAIENSNSANTSVTLTKSATITANFELKTFQVTFTAIGEGTLSGETTQTVSYGSSTTAVTVVSNTGYKFSKWTIGDVSYSTSNPLTISKITEALDLTANFEKMTYSISGTVSGDVKEVSLALSGDSTATATSDANGDYSFTGLSDGSYTVTPSQDTYTFSPASYDVTISGANATGKDFVSTATFKLTMAVSPESSGSTEPSAGTTTISKGSAQTLKATASSGYVFSEWKAEPAANATIANSYSGATSATISGDVTITATFNTESESATLTTAVSPENSGSVTPNSSVEVKINEAVAITATASTGYYFQGWTYTENATVADASSASTTATLTGDATVTALFSAVPVETATLTIKSDSPSGGSTSPETGSESTVNKGAAISVTATPGEGYDFAGWSADSSGNAIIGDASSTSTSVTLSGDATVTASFSVLPVGEATLTLKVDPENAGTLSPEAGSKDVMTGVSQKIEATAASGYYFIGWLGDSNAQIADSASSSTTVLLSGDSSVTALFSATATGELSVGEIKISLKSSKEGKDSAKLIATLPSGTSFDNTSQDLKVMIGDWSVTIAKGSDWKEKKDKISYKEQTDDGKIRADYDANTGILLVDVKKTTVAGKVNPAEGVDVYVVIGDSHYWDNVDVDEKTHWKGLTFEQTDGFALEAKKFLAAWDSKDGGLKEKYSLRVIGSGLTDPFTDGYSDSVVPTISVDQSEWEIEAEPRGGNGKYVYKLRDGSISQYLKLDFEKGKWSFTATDKEPISPLEMSRGGDLTLTVKFTDGTETKYSVIKISPDIRSKITYKAGK